MRWANSTDRMVRNPEASANRGAVGCLGVIHGETLSHIELLPVSSVVSFLFLENSANSLMTNANHL